MNYANEFLPITRVIDVLKRNANYAGCAGAVQSDFMQSVWKHQ